MNRFLIVVLPFLVGLSTKTAATATTSITETTTEVSTSKEIESTIESTTESTREKNTTEETSATENTNESEDSTESSTETSTPPEEVEPPEVLPEIPHTPGWQLVEDTWYYNDDNGNLVTGWQVIKGHWYYFYDNHKMAQGLINLDGVLYYLHPTLGHMMTGWQLIDDTWYYFHLELGNAQRNWIELGPNWYYLDPETAAMKLNWQLINDKWYFLDSQSGAMKKGLQPLGGPWFYLSPETGALQDGWQLLNGKWFYFTPGTGEQLYGWQEINHTWYYLKENGEMVTGTYKINGKNYAFNASGKWLVDHVLLGVKTVNQYQEKVYQGCEPAALWAALTYQKKINTSYRQFVTEMPIANNGNPFEGFGGNPYLPDGSSQQWGFPAMFPQPFTSWAKRYGNVENISNASIETLKDYLSQGIPVVTWVTVHYLSPWWTSQWFGRTLNNNHAVVLDGYDNNTQMVHVADSIDGEKWLSESQFLTAYNARKFAVAILP